MCKCSMESMCLNCVRDTLQRLDPALDIKMVAHPRQEVRKQLPHKNFLDRVVYCRHNESDDKPCLVNVDGSFYIDVRLKSGKVYKKMRVVLSDE